MRKRLFVSFAAALLLLLSVTGAGADRIPEEKPWNYIGAMQVCWCNEWISLREEPSKLSKRLMEIPLGAIVYSCIDIRSDLFVECEYQGVKGYALRKYLKPVPQYEPPVSSSVTVKMTKEEIIGAGEVILEWKDYNMSVIAAREYITEKRKQWEVLRVGCFINDQPVWGHEEKCEVFSQYDMLKVFIGGVEDDWQVMLYDGGYGLSRLDLETMLAGSLFVLLISVLQERGIRIRERISCWHPIPRWAFYSFALTIVLLLGLYGNGYDISTFAYQFFCWGRQSDEPIKTSIPACAGAGCHPALSDLHLGADALCLSGRLEFLQSDHAARILQPGQHRRTFSGRIPLRHGF